jgi:hypothetical protein
MTEISPGEIKEVSVESTSVFIPERLVVGEVSRTFSEKALGWIGVFVWNFLSLFSPNGHFVWRLSPHFPVNLLRFRVGNTDQFSPMNPIPTELFGPSTIGLNGRFDVCRPGQTLTLTVQSSSKRSLVFRAVLIGQAVPDKQL